jgi:hypothetical protein
MAYDSDGNSKYFFRKNTCLPEDYGDFNFANQGTIAVVNLFKYKKNDRINSEDFLNNAEESLIDNISEGDMIQELNVTHNFTVLGLRLLYTLRIEYLLYNRFFKIFDLEEYKKSNQLNGIAMYTNNTSMSDYDPFAYNKNYKKLKKAQTKENNKLSETFLKEMENNVDGGRQFNIEDHPNVRKEIFMVLDVRTPQFNFQNETSNSQLLLVGKNKMGVSLYNYLYRDPKNPRKKHSIKKQIMCKFGDMRAYVAPTNIDILNPTFWMKETDPIEQKDIITDNGDSNNEKNFLEMENLLWKVMKIEECKFNFDIYNKDFSIPMKPLLNIEIMIDRANAWYDPQTWWHLVFVLQNILFATGEESVEKIDQEKIREMELKEYKNNLGEMIQNCLQNAINRSSIPNRPKIDKQI